VVETCNVRCGGDEGGTLYAWAYNGARVSTRHETPPSRNHAPEGDMGVGDRANDDKYYICCSNHSTSLKSKNAHRNRANDDKYYIS
jgi:hypothetical protein